MRCWMLCRLEYKQTLKRTMAELCGNCHDQQPHIWNCATAPIQKKGKLKNQEELFQKLILF